MTAALHILRGAAQSEAALRTRLARRGFDEQTVAAAAAQMVASRYVDDAALAESVSRRRTRSGQGPARIAQDLRRRGVGAEEVEVAMAGLDDERMRAEALLVGRRVVAAHAGDDARQLRQRVGAALQRRGHPMTTIHHVLRSLEVPDTGDVG